MSYLVLARKYRPTRFDEIIGQEHVVRTLMNAIKLGRVHHAFLFTGARGVGKTTTARVLARALNCESGPTIEPCNACSACKDITSGAATDVIEIDGASNTGVDNVRELREAVRYLPSRGRYKLYIIDEVHMLSTAAFNALLKTLEEPPPHVKFIFATTEPQKIPITILSRCQRFDFRRATVRDQTEHIKKILASEGASLSATAITAVVREAQGSVRDALSLIDQVLSFAGDNPNDAQVSQALGIVERETIFALAHALLTRQASTLLDLVAEVDARGHDLSDVAGLLVEHLRDLMVVKVMPNPSEAVLARSPVEIETLSQQAQTVSKPDLHRLFSGLVAVAEDVNRSPHPRVTFEMGLLRLLEIEPVSSLADLVHRFDTIAKGGDGPHGSSPTSGAKGSGLSSGTPKISATNAAQQGTVIPTKAKNDVIPTKAKNDNIHAQAKNNVIPAKAGIQNDIQKQAGPDFRFRDGNDDNVDSVVTPAQPGIHSDDSNTNREVINLGWARLINRVRELKPALASVLEHAHLLQFTPQCVELGFVPKTFYWDTAHDKEFRAPVEGLLKQQFGQPVKLILTPIDTQAKTVTTSIAAQKDEDQKQRQRDLESTAVAHPAVRQAISVLGGEITGVVPLANQINDKQDE
ncbi:MAG: DNA polymerase III subunit gamma/tau [Deltaproteobacteria bacterium]|nr:DNA polymerase III subunit gamma/tau [Deltaproteobacteria bacterium]